MAATGYTPIYLYYSGTPTNVPVAANLGAGELAINAADGNLFYKNTSNAVVTIPVLQSSATQSGWLSSTDWSTFNSKAPAGAYLTSVTSDAPLTGAGTSASHLSMPAATGSVNGYLTSTDWTTFNNKQPAGSYLTAVTSDAPLTGSGTSGSHLSMPAATGSVNGYLTSTDWTTFNGKQTALVSGTNIKTVNGTTLLGSGDLGTIGVPYGGTGITSLTAGQIPYGNGTSAFSSSSNLYFSGSRLGIGTNAPTDQCESYGNGNLFNLRYAVDGGSALIAWKNYAGTVLWDIGGGVTVAQDELSFRHQGTTALLLKSNLDAVVNVGNLVIGTSGKGIDFSATPGTGTSELLADYEEGTWTPTIIGSTSAGTASYTAQSGTYTKIGRLVNFQAYLVWSGGTGTGDLYVSGLPYTSSTAPYGVASTAYQLNVSLSANSYSTGGYIPPSATSIRLMQNTIAGGVASAVPYDAAGEFMIAGSYYV